MGIPASPRRRPRLPKQMMDGNDVCMYACMYPCATSSKIHIHHRYFWIADSLLVVAGVLCICDLRRRAVGAGARPSVPRPPPLRVTGTPRVRPTRWLEGLPASHLSACHFAWLQSTPALVGWWLYGCIPDVIRWLISTSNRVEAVAARRPLVVGEL